MIFYWILFLCRIPGIWEELLVLQDDETDFLQLCQHREGARKPLFPDRLEERCEPDTVVEQVEFSGVSPAQLGLSGAAVLAWLYS